VAFPRSLGKLAAGRADGSIAPARGVPDSSGYTPASEDPRAVFFWLSKTLDVLLSPVLWALVLGLSAERSARRGRVRVARTCGALALSILYAASVPLCVGPLFEHVERFDAPIMRDDVVYDAVVILGGYSFRGPDGRVELSQGGERVLRGYELLASGRARYGLIVGGRSNADDVEADLAAELLRAWGIDRARLLLGRTSVNTHENALEAGALLAAHRLSRAKLVLVTSAFHMQRAIGCFRAVGLHPDALATDHLAPSSLLRFYSFLPRAGTLALSELAIRELFGRLVYRARGYAAP
jgi:uncharacterized SAM-binding protein YcdF (DUF218 family)